MPTEVDSTLKSTKDNNHYYLWVIDPESKEEVLVYVDTSIQDILYDPITFRGDYKSNYSGLGTCNTSSTVKCYNPGML